MMKRRTLVLAALALGIGALPAWSGTAAESTAGTPVLAPAEYEIDRAHSQVQFKIKHLGISTVTGRFGDFSGSIVYDPQNMAGSRATATIKAASIDTNNERRDNHLRSGDFFDAATHPTITFRSTRVEANGRDLRVHGNLTLRGVTKPVVLQGRLLEVGGVAGKRRIGFEASTTVNRMDYGVSWNRAAEGGGAVLGDEVEITLNIEAVEQAAS
jgi:polyisoprenoid-binding protein YceI